MKSLFHPTTFLSLHEEKTNLNSLASALGFPLESKLVVLKDRSLQTFDKKMKQLGSKTSPSHHPPNFTRLVSQPEELPNYMKSTISADARRELSKASTARHNPRTSPDHSSLHTTKFCSTSRQESTLVKKSTTTLDVLCGSLEVARATCSSTLKGSKFPDYPGGAGLQGTSGLKVCPCSYCSLNGRLRALVPPLKRFVPARRHELRAKRSIKMKCQTPNATFAGAKRKAIKHDKDTKDSSNEPATGDTELNSIEDECSIVHENKATPETEDARSTRATDKSEKSNQESEEPRGLHLQGAEKVSLRHQELEARKNAEEWMVDYAIREAVTKGGTYNKRKVMLLVEAFERVLPTSKH